MTRSRFLSLLAATLVAFTMTWAASGPGLAASKPEVFAPGGLAING